MAKVPTLQAVKAYVEEFVDVFTKYLQAFHTWDKNFKYNAEYPCFYHGKCFYANPYNPPLKGQDPEQYPECWIPIAGEGGGGTYEFDEAIKALKLYTSIRTLMVTNANTVTRRMRGWDIGVQLLSENCEVYHFDTDFLNQKQQNTIYIDYSGDAPNLVGFSPAVKDIPPYEPAGKSIFGNFSILKTTKPTNNCTVSFWVRFPETENIFVINFGTFTDKISFFTGGVNPEYGAAFEGDPIYSVPEPGDIVYSIAGTNKHVLVHSWLSGSETIDLEALGVVINPGVWLNIAAVLTLEQISLFVDDISIIFDRNDSTIQPLMVEINAWKSTINIDELLFDETVSLSFSAHQENTVNRIPWAPLSYLEPWLVLEAADVRKVKTNLYDTEEFKAAVRAVIEDSH